MGIRKRGNVYWMIKQHNGKRVERSLDTGIKRVAEERYSKIVSEMIDGSYSNKQYKKKSLKEMIDRYQAEYTDHKAYYCKARDKSTISYLYKYFLRDTPRANAKLSLEELSQLAGNITLEDVENQIGGYEQWRRAQGKMPATIVKDLGLLRRMFNVARKQWKWKINNPISEIELPKVNNERVRYLNPKEHIALIAALETPEEAWLKPFVLVALDTGLRLNNLCNLMRTEVVFSPEGEGSIWKSSEVMKNRQYLGVPLTRRACETIKELLKVPCVTGHIFHNNGKPLYDRQVQRAFKKVLLKAGITDFHVHDMRHTFASYLRQMGFDLHTIGTLLGNKDLRTVKRYAHQNMESLRDVISKLETVTILRQSDGLDAAKTA